MGNLILSHTKTSYIAARDLPYRYFIVKQLGKNKKLSLRSL